jgi:gas vesicle protein
MARSETNDFLVAFAVGAVLGATATLLLRSSPKTAKERLLRELKPYRAKLGRGARRMERGSRGGRAGGMAAEAIDTGRELLSEFRDEVRRIVSDAVEEVNEAVEGRGEKRSRGAGRSRGRKPAEAPE